MKILLMIVLCFISNATFALSCPNNGEILDEGDDIQVVLARCGSPTSQKK